MDWSTVITTIITGLGDVGPVTYLAILVTGALGYVWFMDRRSYEGQLKSLRDEFAAMVAQKDSRYDAREAAYTAREAGFVASIDEAHRQVAALNKDYSTANKDTAEIVNQVAQTLATLASTMKGGRHD